MTLASPSREALIDLAMTVAARSEIDLHAVLETQATRCRRLALCVNDRQAVDTLLLMASEYDEKAHALAAG